MADEFFTLTDTTELTSAADLTLHRARELASAIRTHPDFSLLQVLRSGGEDGPEYLVVDIECHGVPGRNPHGIQCPERAALVVQPDPSRLVEVLMLRKGFPLLMHQNQPGEDRPANLCLYFESPVSVFRTWTPQRFLQRILWWLEKSAKDELHPADQPVEGLFFASRYELVLPWNYHDLREDKNQRLIAVLGDKRPDQGITCFMKAIPAGATASGPPLTHIALTLPTIVHGTVEPDPVTLGDLADLLSRRGIDLLASLRSEIQSHTSQDGVPLASDSKLTIILLNIPIRHHADETVIAIQSRAFLLLSGGCKLGESMGALFLHAGKYFNSEGVIGGLSKDEWRAHDVWPMAVLRFNDPAAARSQSGISDEGPQGVLIGAGSLGSSLLNLWGRSGWGRWAVVDKDHIKPHNLTRHTTYAQHVGSTKADAVAGLHSAMSNGSSIVTAINADACAFNSEPVASTLKAATLVVDASTTLEYPRSISGQDDAPRHVCVFITPNGNAAVMLAEDAACQRRLRTLEAQYYRALIEQDWGGTHLEGAKTFWSGASCRDISYVLPYARIQGHASTLAEQLPVAVQDEAARIRVWQRDPATGSVALHNVPVQAERSIPFGRFQLFMDDEVELSLRELRRKTLPNETGGVLLGYFDLNIQAVVIVTALPAPPDSKGSPGGFERGTEGLRERIAEVARRTAGIVGYIGEWHSHPRGHSAQPSSDDLTQLGHLAEQMANEGLPAIQLIVGEKDLSLLQGAATSA